MQLLAISLFVLAQAGPANAAQISCDGKDYAQFISAITWEDLDGVTVYSTACPSFINKKEDERLGMTPLMFSAYTHSFSGTEGAVIVQYLLTHGAKVNAQDSYGSTALHNAVWYGNEHIVHILLRSGADANIRNHEGDMPLDVAMSVIGNDDKPRVNQNIVRLLKRYGARSGNLTR